jgi:cyclopropane-fatty-acyl-phospholipid synthase
MNTHLGTSAQAIEYHYDVGNDFYQLWLDRELLSYTCALWERGDETLEDAQRNKVAFHCRQARILPGHRVLDIGCGWGGMLRYALDECKAAYGVGMTLSPAQADFIRSTNRSDMEVHVQNWLDHECEEPYDAITAVGVIEHAAKARLDEREKIDAYRRFFARAHRWLKPGGWLSLQSVIQDNMRPEDLNEFFSTSVLPETDLPTLADLATASQRYFETVRVRNDRLDYERTCREWLRRLKLNRRKAIELAGEQTVERYEKWLQLTIIGFHVGTTGLIRIAFRKFDHPRK